MTQSPTGQVPAAYRLRVAGRLDHRWSPWFEDVAVTCESDGTTSLTGVVDQARLHGLLSKIRDLGVPLLSVELLPEAERAVRDR